VIKIYTAENIISLDKKIEIVEKTISIKKFIILKLNREKCFYFF